MPVERSRRNTPANDDVLDANEAAWLLGAHVETVRRLARRGKLPCYKIGKDWRFSKKSLLKWVKSHALRHQSPLVLVVDDDKNVRDVMGLYIEEDGYRVALAESGAAALETAKREMPAVVLLDLAMPGMSGVDVLKALRAIDQDLPVIMVTGYPDSELLVDALRYPPITLLPKPVEKEVICKTVRLVLDGARRHLQTV